MAYFFVENHLQADRKIADFIVWLHQKIQQKNVLFKFDLDTSGMYVLEIYSITSKNMYRKLESTMYVEVSQLQDYESLLFNISQKLLIIED